MFPSRTRRGSATRTAPSPTRCRRMRAPSPCSSAPRGATTRRRLRKRPPPGPTCASPGGALRASYLREIVHGPDFALPQIDPAYHDYWARGIATGDWTLPKNLSDWADPQIGSHPYLRPPAYPFFLAGVYYLSGGSYLAARVVQMVLGLANCILAWRLGRRVFGSATGLIFAALMACYWAFIYFEGELLEPVLLVTLGLALFYVLSLWSERFTFARGLTGGVLLGLFALVRANILLFVPVVLAWSWWVARRRRDHRRLAPIGLAFVAGTVLTIAPVTIRNWVVAKDVVLITSNIGISLYTGNHEEANGRYTIIPDLKELGAGDDWTCFDYPKMAQGVERKLGRKVKHSEVSSYFVEKAMQFIRTHPARALELVAIKAALFWGPQEVGSNKVIALEKSNSATLRYLPGFSLALSLAIFGLVAAAGVAVMAYAADSQGVLRERMDRLGEFQRSRALMRAERRGQLRLVLRNPRDTALLSPPPLPSSAPRPAPSPRPARKEIEHVR